MTTFLITKGDKEIKIVADNFIRDGDYFHFTAKNKERDGVLVAVILNPDSIVIDEDGVVVKNKDA